MAESRQSRQEETKCKSLFDLRMKLFVLSRRIDSVEDLDCIEKLRFFFKKTIPREQYLAIRSGCELFAVLEQLNVISEDNIEPLRGPLRECCPTYEDCLATSSSFSSKDEFHFNLDNVPVHCREQLEEEYRSCLVRIDNGLARADGSLPQLIYLCPEIPLDSMHKLKSARELFAALEEKVLISCTQLSYLYSRLRVLHRLDLAEEIEGYIFSARQHIVKQRRSSLVRSPSDPGRSTPVSNGIVSQHSLPQDGMANSSQKITKPKQQRKFQATEAKPRGLSHQSKEKPESSPGTSRKVIKNGKHKGVSKHTSQRPIETIDIFNHFAYRCLDHIESYPVIKYVIRSLIVVIFVMRCHEYVVEEESCGRCTALLNLLSSQLTHVGISLYFLYCLLSLNTNQLKKLRFFQVAGKQSYSDVISKVVYQLSSSSERKELEGKSVIESVNFILRKKLMLVLGTSLLLSVVFFSHLQASNVTTFLSSTYSLSVSCVFVTTPAAFLVHCTTGVVFCFYLFEMRVREYCNHISRLAKQDSRLLADCEALSKAILDRWGNFRWVLFAGSVAYLILLVSSIYSGTPFHCHRESVEAHFSEAEWNQIRNTWLFNIMTGVVCHAMVYNCFNFTSGRYIAMIVQAYFFFISISDFNGQKWSILVQIVNAVYPVSILLSFHLLACHNIWNKKRYSSETTNIIAILSNTLTNLKFTVHSLFIVAHVIVVSLAIYSEYQALAYSKISK